MTTHPSATNASSSGKSPKNLQWLSAPKEVLPRFVEACEETPHASGT
jgi:hypothetical protein